MTKPWLEKYAKKLIGRTDLEDALKRLDKLTYEEAQMATAEFERANVIEEMEMVGADSEPVLPVEAAETGVDDKVTEVITGTQINIIQA